ncbi:MAG: S-adenosylmethionine:tRNA ribosyltransferase-isomerase, partial [Phycisphaerae bacterium]|nr:S-adenosylmethionine:tRNA ribosyltransferase-isomerase [Phycisphaerae bacterium]
MTPKTADFDYDLPDELIAQKPIEPRDKSRLMVLDRTTGEIRHHHFGELPALLREGDLLVLNDTRVIPAKFLCRRRTGGQIEGLFLRELSAGRWEVMLKGAGRCKTGEELTFVEEPLTIAKLESNLGEGLWHVAVSPPCDAVELLERIGSTPLPPYIHRKAYHGRPGHDSLSSRARRPCYVPRAGRPCHEDKDRQTYQTIYAARPGAVAAPTAGLHFTENILADLQARKIESL